MPKPVDSSTPIACSTPDMVAPPEWHADPADAATVSDNYQHSGCVMGGVFMKTRAPTASLMAITKRAGGVPAVLYTSNSSSALDHASPQERGGVCRGRLKGRDCAFHGWWF